MMKIAYLINQYPAISHSFIRREIQALERQGVQVERYAIRPSGFGVLSPEDADETTRTRHIVGGDKKAHIKNIFATLLGRPLGSIKTLAQAVRMGWRSESGLLKHIFYWAEALIIAQWLGQDNVRHVHAHFGTNSTTVAMLAVAITGGSYSMTVHGPEEFDKPALISLPAKIEKAEFVAGVSSYGVSQLRRLVAYEHWPKIQQVHCGIEDSFWAGAAPKVFDNAVFVSVGRLSEQKGQMTLVEAAAILKDRGRRFEIKLIGDGDLRAPIEVAIAQKGLKDYVHLLGWQTPSQVRAALEDARIFVLPSYAEGLPVSIMEAYALSTPVISSYVAGIPELVKPDVNGWLAPAADAVALADVMEAALGASPEKLLAMGQDGHARVMARHHIDGIAQQLCQHFAKTAGATDGVAT